MFLTMGATVALLALPVAAQTQPAPAAAPAAQDGCAQETRDALYKTFTDNRTADQKKAYDAAKKYLGCPVATPTESQTKIIEYLTRWVGLYEKGSRKNRFNDELYNKKNYVEAFKVGGEILKDEPDNTKIMVDLGANGYLVGPLNNPSLAAEAVEYAKKALAALESGKTVEDWTPLQNKDVAVAYLNYTIGSLTVDKDPANALKYLIKSAQFETPLKKSAFTYALIHLSIYLVFDQLCYSLETCEFRAIWEDILKRKFIFVGQFAFLCLLLLAITSTNGWMRRLKRNWTRLHKLVYVAAIAGVVHFIWIQKSDLSEPLKWTAWLAGLLLFRIGWAIFRRRPAAQKPVTA